jgi:hypothetical protein
MILMPKSPNQSCQFSGLNRETADLGFEAQPRNPTLVLRLNQEICALISTCTVQTTHGVT